MPFLEHLEELRGVLLQSAALVALFACGGWFLSSEGLDLLIRPVGSLVFLGPTEAFTLRLKIALLLGFLASLPFVLYKVWSFVAPGLFERERRFVVLVVGASTVLFLAGAAFGLFVLVPIAVAFLLGFGTESLRPMIAAGNYFAFVTKLLLAFGVVFQLPLAVTLLTHVGLLQPEWLLRKWRYAIVVIAVVSAVLTPPDVASQILMGVPVLALYFLSILISFAVRKKRREENERDRESEEGEGGEETGGENGDEIEEETERVRRTEDPE
ncbi:MAG: twin-arginine translocase subunit TatC [Candidatus Eisenbacteria bacterium]|nr:twin-arginine translocase subunit TatC [Candidatus Eisenbacteria bacterium]